MADQTIADLAAGLGVDVDKASFSSATEALEKIILLLTKMAGGAAEAAMDVNKALATIALPGQGAHEAGHAVHEAGEGVHFLKHALSALIGLHAAHELYEMTEHTIELGAQMGDLADKTGTSVEEIQELGYAAEIHGLSTQFMANTLAKLSVTLDKAAGGSKEAAQAFRQAGIAVKDVEGKTRPAAEVLGDVADYLSKLDEKDRPAKAFELLGRQGKELLPLLKDGKEGLEKFREEARELGLVMDKETIEAMDKVEKNTKRLGKVWDGLKEQAIESLIPAIKDLTDNLLAWAKANRKDIAEGIKAVFKVVLFVVKNIVTGIKVIIKILSFFAKNWGLVVIAILSVAAAYAILEAKAIKTGYEMMMAWIEGLAPILAVAAAIALILLLFDDIYAWIQGEDSIMGDLFGDADTVLDRVGEAIKKAFGAALDWVKKKAKEAWAAITGTVMSPDETARWAADKLKNEGKISDSDYAFTQKFGAAAENPFDTAKFMVDQKYTPQINVPGSPETPSTTTVSAPITQTFNITGDPATIMQRIADEQAAMARKLESTIGGAKKK